jgi:hypothetical protein
MPKPRKKKTKAKLGKLEDYISAEYIALWDKDFDDLEQHQRVKMIELFMRHTQDYEYGLHPVKIKHPAFMEQEDKIKAYEAEQRERGLEEKKKKEELIKKQEKLQKLQQEWERDRIVVMNKEEQLELENFNLKIQIAEIKEREWREKKEELIKEQESRTVRVAEKYEITVDNYIVDPFRGMFVRGPALEFPYTLDNLPEDEE